MISGLTYNNQTYNNRQDIGIYFLILFLIWPFLALIYAIVNYSLKESKRVVYIYLIYFGLTFVINNEGYSDAVGYIIDFKKNVNLPFSALFTRIIPSYLNGTTADVLEPAISFFVSRFTDNYRFLFGAYAAVFGFFYLKSINLLHNEYQKNRGWDSIIYLAFFTLVIPITSINGFRMWTASWIFFYGAYNVILNKQIKYFVVTLFAALLHYSFISVNLILVIYFLLGNKNYIYAPLAVLSFGMKQFASNFFFILNSRLGGGAISGRISSYTDEENILSRQDSYETASWFLKIGNSLVMYFFIIAIIVIQLSHKKYIKDKADKNLYSFILLFITFVNIGSSIPSLGSRFQLVFFLFATLYVFKYFAKSSKKTFSPLTYLAAMPFLLFAVINLRMDSGCIDAWLFSPLFGVSFFAPSMSLYELFFQ